MVHNSVIAKICLILLFLVSCSRQPVYSEPTIIGSEVVIDIKNLKPEIPQFYTYRYLNKKINFFVIKTDDKVLSFLDACINCYLQKLGYRFNDGHVICRACNVRYSVSGIEKGFGSCLPIKVPGRLQNGTCLIQVSELQKMADRF